MIEDAKVVETTEAKKAIPVKLIPPNLYEALMAYLESRPYSEVSNLVAQLSQATNGMLEIRPNESTPQ